MRAAVMQAAMRAKLPAHVHDLRHRTRGEVCVQPGERENGRPVGGRFSCSFAQNLALALVTGAAESELSPTEGVGFEPTRLSPTRRFSRPVHSTALPSLQHDKSSHFLEASQPER